MQMFASVRQRTLNCLDFDIDSPNWVHYEDVRCIGKVGELTGKRVRRLAAGLGLMENGLS